MVHLFSYDTDALLNMIAFFDLINHSDGIVRIADDAFAAAVQRQFFSGKDIFSGAFTISLEISGRADERPLYIISFTQFRQFLALRLCQRQEHGRKVRPVTDNRRMFRIYIQAACSADD